MRQEVGGRIQAEITTTQLETATGICRTLAEIRAEIACARLEATAAAESAGVRDPGRVDAPVRELAAPGDHARPRATRRWSSAGRRSPSSRTSAAATCTSASPISRPLSAVMDRARPYLPVLLAMTGSSPFHGGLDTGYDSYRTLWWSRWPMTGIPEYFGSAERFREVVEGLVASGVVADASHLYWDLRPSQHLPTLEFRLADVCTDVDDAVLHAALARSLVRVLAERARAGPPSLPPAARRSCSGRPAGGPPGTAWPGSCSTPERRVLVEAPGRGAPAARRARGRPPRPRRVGRGRRAGGPAVRPRHLGSAAAARPGCARGTRRAVAAAHRARGHRRPLTPTDQADSRLVRSSPTTTVVLGPAGLRRLEAAARACSSASRP